LEVIVDDNFKIFEENKTYSQAGFTKAGLGCKTKFWRLVAEKKIQTIQNGRLTQFTGKAGNAYVASLAK
jgi:hypothetical protein